jgi:hypothetical protein
MNFDMPGLGAPSGGGPSSAASANIDFGRVTDLGGLGSGNDKLFLAGLAAVVLLALVFLLKN